VIILFLTATPIFTWGYESVLYFSKGVSAVDYIPTDSNCKYKSDFSDKLISYKYHITLKNYSNQPVKFNMQVQKPTTGTLTMLDVTEENSQGKHVLKEFTLYPREQEQFEFIINNQKNEYSFLDGNMKRPNITIFNKEKSRQFKVR
jgi:hypothetical protein